MEMTTKERVLDLIIYNTKYCNLNEDKFNASYVASELFISRSLASQYLNELFREGFFIKIDARPTLFYFNDLMVKNGKRGKTVFWTLDEYLKYRGPIKVNRIKLLIHKTIFEDEQLFRDVLDYVHLSIVSEALIITLEKGIARFDTEISYSADYELKDYELTNDLFVDDFTIKK